MLFSAVSVSGETGAHFRWLITVKMESGTAESAAQAASDELELLQQRTCQSGVVLVLYQLSAMTSNQNYEI